MTQFDRNVFGAVLTSHSGVVNEVVQHPAVADAVDRATAAGISWIAIFMTILPFVTQILSGGTIDWQAIIAAILALITPKPPARR